MYSILGLLLFILIVILLVILFGNGSALQPTDYCHAPLCDKGVVHVACNPNLYNKFAPNCVSPKQIPMDGPLQQVILDQHNVLRSQVATGNLTGFPAASNMQEMVLFSIDLTEHFLIPSISRPGIPNWRTLPVLMYAPASSSTTPVVPHPLFHTQVRIWPTHTIRIRLPIQRPS